MMRVTEALDLMMRVTEALDLLLLAQMPPMGRRAPMVKNLGRAFFKVPSSFWRISFFVESRSL